MYNPAQYKCTTLVDDHDQFECIRLNVLTIALFIYSKYLKLK